MTKRRIISLLLSAAMLLTAMTACNRGTPDDDGFGNVANEIEASPVPVQIMTRDAQDWKDYSGDTFIVQGNGNYYGTVSVPGSYTTFPNIAISAVGTDTSDAVHAGAEVAPPEYLNATVTINSVWVNGEPLVLKNNENVLFVADGDSRIKGYANVQIWNAWWEPNQRINVEETDGLSLLDGYLHFSSPVSTIEVDFTVSNVGAESPPESASDDVEPEDAEEPFEDDEPVNVTITGGFDASITAEQLVGNIGVGWNLGNTLDAYTSGNPSDPGYWHWVDYDDMVSVETAWIQGPQNATTYSLIRRVKRAGFNAIRIPVTWYKMAGGAPDYTIREDWMAHVQSIVNMAVAEDMYIILNTHHDEYIMRFDEDPAVGEQAVKALWTQIGERFRDYDEKLIFEGLNEPRARRNGWDTNGNWDWGGNEAMYIAINRWNQAFVNVVRGTGGNNEKRHLMLATYGAQTSDGPIKGFALPNDPVAGNGISRFIWSVHVYSPHEWAHDGRGNYAGAARVQADLDRVANRAAELGIPVIFGEWGSVTSLSVNDRAQHAHDYVRIVTSMRDRDTNPVVMACFWWDDAGQFALVNRTGNISANSKRIISAITRARDGLGLE